MTKLDKDILLTQEIINNDIIWSTYASAQEILNNQFHPSGIDYIIHVLGDKTRTKYMKYFENSNQKWVATINEDYNRYEYWNRKANWFFYRNLFKNWHPVFANNYNIFWEKNKELIKTSINIPVKIIKLSNSSVKLLIETENRLNGYADVKLSWQVKKNNGFHSYFVFNTNIRLVNTGFSQCNDAINYDSNYLRACGEEYVPIQVHNGCGEITITSNPASYTNLIINFAECDNFYKIFDEIEKVIKNPITGNIQDD